MHYLLPGPDPDNLVVNHPLEHYYCDSLGNIQDLVYSHGAECSHQRYMRVEHFFTMIMIMSTHNFSTTCTKIYRGTTTCRGQCCSRQDISTCRGQCCSIQDISMCRGQCCSIQDISTCRGQCCSRQDISTCRG